MFFIFHLYQSVTNIYEYLNIQIYWLGIFIQTFIPINFLYKWIWIFVCVKFVFTNIFGHMLLSVWKLVEYSNIIKYTNRMYLNILTIFKTNIYLDIHLCQIFDTNIFGHWFIQFFDSNWFGYSFVLKFSRMSHSWFLLKIIGCFL